MRLDNLNGGGGGGGGGEGGGGGGVGRVLYLRTTKWRDARMGSMLPPIGQGTHRSRPWKRSHSIAKHDCSNGVTVIVME